VYSPGHLGELTQVIDPQLVDAVLEETGSRERRVRLLPARVVVYFVLALTFFERCSYRAVWDELGAGLGGIKVVRPCASSLSRARRRLGATPLRRLFEILAGPVAIPAQTGSFYRGLRVVAVDGTTLTVPDEEALTWHFPKHVGEVKEFGYPLLRLVALVECGTRALLGAVLGPDTIGELGYARRLLHHLDASTVLLADLLRRLRLPAGGNGQRGVLPAALDSQTASLGASPAAGRLLPDHGLCGEVPGRTRLRAPGGVDHRSPDDRQPG
jgi:hypothetical protein